MEHLNQYRVTNIALENVGVVDSSITIEYRIDDHVNILQFAYNTISLDDPMLHMDTRALHAYAVSLAVISLSRFGAVLPRYFDIAKYAPWVHPRLLRFLRKVLPRHWSEHRFQLEKLDYHHPEFIYDEPSLGSKVTLPIWGVDEFGSQKVMVASGSGKDSLLCEKILERAAVQYESFTYLHDLYGDLARQREIFNRIPRLLQPDSEHVVTIYDDYAHWLEKRVASFSVTEVMTQLGMTKNFRKEAGEVFVGSFSMIPVQIARSIPLQVFGNEKSADFPNLIDRETGEGISHQFAKSIYAEESMFRLYEKMFSGVNRVSITKPIYDVAVFKNLFKLAGDLSYSTNSCNVKKPWCLRCEKCLYVFAGFVAFGDLQNAIDSFGKNLLDDPEILPVWEDVLGLRGRIAWECVGHPEEAQLYFYKMVNRGVGGCAIDMFRRAILEPLSHTQNDAKVARHFDSIESKYSKLHTEHHHMPEWLSEKIFSILRSA